MNYSAQTSQRISVLKPVIITGFTAGTLDAIAAIIVYQANPMRMFQYIASAAIGRDIAFSGEWGTAFLGLCFHYTIAFSWTLLFFLAFPWIQKLRINKFLVGIIYGAIVWTGMNLLVLPLSQLPKATFTLKPVIIGMSILMVMIGIPISLFAHKFYANKS
jgi:hypothetical protein